MITDNSKVRELVERLDRLDRTQITIGILGKENSKMLIIAASNEFGAPSVNIPERSYIRASFDKYKEDITNFSVNLIERYIDGKISYDVCMNTIGEYCKTKIQKYMVDLKEPPNAQSTIDIKGSDSPLIDTGHLLNSISYKVEVI